jgi:hypothetical protein
MILNPLYLNKLHLTGVWQDCEFCSKYTFTFREKFYLKQKIIGSEVRNLEKRQNVNFKL